MKRISQVQPNADLARDELLAQELQRCLVRRSRRTQGQLASEIGGHATLPPFNRLAVNRLVLQAVHLGNLLIRRTMHPD